MIFTKSINTVLNEILDNPLFEIANVSKASGEDKFGRALVYLIKFLDTTSTTEIEVLLTIYPDYKDGFIQINCSDKSYDFNQFKLNAHIDLTNPEIYENVKSIAKMVEDILDEDSFDKILPYEE